MTKPTKCLLWMQVSEESIYSMQVSEEIIYTK